MRPAHFPSVYTLRDYLAYINPVVFGLSLLALALPQMVPWVKDNWSVVYPAIIFGSYPLGFVFHTVFWRLLVPVLYRVCGNPTKKAFGGLAPSEDEHAHLFNRARAIVLRDHGRADDASGNDLFYLAWDDVLQWKHPSRRDLERRVTHSNLAASLTVVFLAVPSCLLLILWYAPSELATWARDLWPGYAALLLLFGLLMASMFLKCRYALAREVANLRVSLERRKERTPGRGGRRSRRQQRFDRDAKRRRRRG
jgi:hypothetical protein